MNAVKPTPFTTPDGVERQLRFTLGARRIIQDSFGMTLKEALDKYDSGAFPEILYALMHDDKGNPPEGVTVQSLKFNLAAEDSTEILAAIMAAASNGKTEKKEIEALLKENLKKRTAPLGSASGASAPTPELSDSQTGSSGGDTLSARSSPELTATANGNGLPITEQVS